jgi:hypothetical protein
MSVPYKDLLSFGSMTLLVGALGLALLLLWGWQSGQELPLWPALLVAGVNVFGALNSCRKPGPARPLSGNRLQRLPQPLRPTAPLRRQGTGAKPNDTAAPAPQRRPSLI